MNTMESVIDKAKRLANDKTGEADMQEHNG
jgi:hypothetical protein